MKKLLVFLLAATMLLSVVYALRNVLLPMPAKCLIEEDALQKADAMIVLSGSGYDRGNEAARLFNEGYVSKIVCPGGNPAYEFRILKLYITESEAAKLNLTNRNNVPDSAITVIACGTSTIEEAKCLYNFIKQQKYQKVILLTSLYHTQRAGRIFRKEFENSNVQFIVRGAKSSRFDEYKWWHNEDGLIAMNNEMIKSVYYLFK